MARLLPPFDAGGISGGARAVLLDIDLDRYDQAGVIRGIHRFAHEQPAWRLRPWVLTSMAGATRDAGLRGVHGYLGAGHAGVLRRLHRLGTPCVAVWTGSSLPENQAVFTDPRAWAVMVDQHFAAIHRPQLAMVLPTRNRSKGASLRCAALHALLAETGRTLHVLEWRSSADANEQARNLKRLVGGLGGLPKPAGVVAAQDWVGWWVLEACRSAGLRVPQDVAVLGSNHHEPIGELCQPPLSSVVYDHERVGYEAARLLDRLMRGGAAPDEPIRVAPLGVVGRESTRPSAAEDPMIEEALRRIESELENGITVAALVGALPTSRRTLHRRFLETLGRAPGEVIRRTRTERAKRLLVTTLLPVTQVAVRCGYPNPSQLTRDVKRATGQPPLRYRAKMTRSIE